MRLSGFAALMFWGCSDKGGHPSTTTAPKSKFPKIRTHVSIESIGVTKNPKKGIRVRRAIPPGSPVPVLGDFVPEPAGLVPRASASPKTAASDVEVETTSPLIEVTTTAVPTAFIEHPRGGSRASTLARLIEDLDPGRWPLYDLELAVKTLLSGQPEDGIDRSPEELWRYFGGPMLMWRASRDPPSFIILVLRLMSWIDFHGSERIPHDSIASNQLNLICSSQPDVIRGKIREAHASAWSDRKPRDRNVGKQVTFVGFTAHAAARCKAVFEPDAEMMGISISHRAFKYSMAEPVGSGVEVLGRSRRDNVFETSLSVLESDAAALRRLGVQRIYFEGEEGVGAGVVRDWIAVMAKNTMEPSSGLFESVAVDDGDVYMKIRPGISDARMIRKARAFGVFLGICLIHQHAPGFELSVMLYAKLVGAKISLDDIKPYEPAIYRSMKSILDARTVGEFPVPDVDVGPETHVLTMENREEVVSLYINSELEVDSVALRAMQNGFRSIVPKEILTGFTGTHMRKILMGVRTIDLDELKSAFDYVYSMDGDGSVAECFWEAVVEFDQGDLQLLVRFISGMVYLPIGGITALPQRFKMRFVDAGRLPEAHTCFYTIEVPRYSTKEVMKERLLRVIRETAGLGMFMA